jgi:uncharacterized protein (DUF362 family)
MSSKVVLVEIKNDPSRSFKQALELLGDFNMLNTPERPVVIKPGVFDHKKKNHPTVSVMRALVQSFNSAPQIFLVESDNYRGTGLERLQLWREVFTNRVVPFNLSEDTNTQDTKIGDETLGFSHILFNPKVFVSIHALRHAEMGTILKNLLGLIPDSKKARFHDQLVTVLLDSYEAIGGIDLAVIDATCIYADPSSEDRIDTNVLVLGRDAVAVESVGMYLTGLDPTKMPLIQEAMNRGLGEGDINNIEVLGAPLEQIRDKCLPSK